MIFRGLVGLFWTAEDFLEGTEDVLEEQDEDVLKDTDGDVLEQTDEDVCKTKSCSLGSVVFKHDALEMICFLQYLGWHKTLKH